MFHQLEPEDDYSIFEEPELPGFGTSFMLGRPITETLPAPLVFKSDYPRDSPPKGVSGLSIPVWSAEFVKLLRWIGVDNFECFEAKVVGDEPGVEWTNYFAVNIIGMVAAANLAKSKYVAIMESPGGTPFSGITDLKLDPQKAHSHDLFRLAENPSLVIVSQRIVDALEKHVPERGWGICTFEIEEG